MHAIERFEDIKCWQLARELVSRIYELTRSPEFSRDFGLRDQLRRASVSIMSNIAEGFERNTKKEFIQYLYIARGSAGEVRSQLYVALDLSYIDEDIFCELSEKATTISKAIFGFIQYLTSIKKTCNLPTCNL